ncbi:MAG: GLUG motif-containing protein, partial [bacterium]
MKNFLTIFLFIVIFFGASLTLGSHSAFAFSGTGSGTAIDPYLITSCLELEEMNLDLASNYILNNDIDCSATSISDENNPNYNASLYNSGAGFLPIADFANNGNVQFTGNFNGQSHKITGLYINRAQDYVGLFGYIATGSNVKNIGLENVNITGINNVGGLAGMSYGTVLYSYTTGEVNGSWQVGGLIGANDGSDTIISSFSSATVTASVNIVGGLVGTNVGVIENSYATGDVYTVNGDAGGLVGLNGTPGSISNSYSTGSVTGNGNSANGGGFAGLSSTSILNSFSTGLVSGFSSSFGGFIGIYSGGTLVNNFYDQINSGQTECYVGSGSSIGGCNAVNTGVEGDTTDGNYFKNNSINTPLTSWHFINPQIWNTSINFPTLSMIARAPVANNVLISGSATVGSLLSGTYTYSDTESDPEQGSTFKWYRDGVEIAGEVNNTYTTTSNDINKMVKFEVTPRAGTGMSPGIAVKSSNGIIVNYLKFNFSKLYDFDGANGTNPYYGSLAVLGDKLYGMTVSGGASGVGMIFSYDTEGYHKLYDFDGT